jgi:hypothetical protein
MAGENESNNLNELMQLLLQQYQDFVNRKERLENKALGCLTPLSIMLAVTIAIMIMVAQEEKGLMFLFLLFLFFGQLYFSGWTFYFYLKAYSVKTTYYPDIKKYTEEWQIEKDDFLGGINKGFMETIDILNRVLEKLVENVQYCKIFLTIALIFGILNIVFFIGYLLQDYIRV